VHDGVTFEKNGIPSAVITTTEFVNAAKIQAEALGMPQFSVITVSHPIQNLTSEEVKARADGIVERIVAKLSQSL